MIDDGDEDRPHLKVTRLSDVAPERLEWLWEGWLPKGKIVTLDGDPGLGKSTAALDFAATITTGGSWPDGTRCEHPGDVLLLSGEDGLADTVRPRLDAARAAVDHVHAIEGKSYFDAESNQRYLRPLTLADVTDLGDVMAATGARLLIVDVLMAFLPGGTDAHKDQDIRRVLSALSTAADTNGCTVLLLRHLNKTKGGDPLYRGGGSIGIVGAARSGLLVAADPDDPTQRVLASIKSNLGVTPNSLTYRLVDTPEHGVAHVEWIGASNHTAATVLADSNRDDEHDEHDYTADLKGSWLYQYLAAARSDNAKVQPREAVSYGGDQGSSRRTTFRLFDKLKKAGFARSVDAGGFPKKTFWEVTEEGGTAGTTGPSLPEGGTTGTTGPDLHKQGGTTGEPLLSDGTTEATGPDLRKQDGSSPVVPVVPSILEEAEDPTESDEPGAGSTERSAPVHALPAATTEKPAKAHRFGRAHVCSRCYVVLPAAATGGLCDDCDGAPPPQEPPAPNPPLTVVHDGKIAKRNGGLDPIRYSEPAPNGLPPRQTPKETA